MHKYRAVGHLHFSKAYETVWDENSHHWQELNDIHPIMFEMCQHSISAQLSICMLYSIILQNHHFIFVIIIITTTATIILSF